MDATDNRLRGTQYCGCWVVDFYLHSRTHLALDKDPPFSRAVAPSLAGRVVATPEVGGLHHRYDRVAA